jgi:hypothetical protein
MFLATLKFYNIKLITKGEWHEESINWSWQAQEKNC